MVATSDFENAVETACGFAEEAANTRDEIAKLAAWTSAELWFAEAAHVLDREEAGR